MAEYELTPNGSTHTRDGEYYKVESSRVWYWYDCEWVECHESEDVQGWLEELRPINTEARN